ncbi:unnamed protein product [Cercospora beticola]|nr:unnamed protein product [Cercospora beticola]
MPSPLASPGHHVAVPFPTALAFAFLISSILANVAISAIHSLVTSAVAWLSICMYTAARTGARSLLENTLSKRLSWTAGALLALAHVCDRAVDGDDIQWAKVNTQILKIRSRTEVCGLGTPSGIGLQPDREWNIGDSFRSAPRCSQPL